MTENNTNNTFKQVNGRSTMENVAYFVGYNALTVDDYKAITGKDYVASPVA